MQFYELKILFLLRKLLSLPQILANSMSKTIVNIITEDNPIPAYLFIKEKYEDGDKLMYISAKDTEDDLDALSELFNVPATHIEEIVLKNDMDEFTYEKICRTVLGRLKQGINYCVNLAGGTRYMALAIQQVFEQFKAEFFYVQVEENLLVKSLFDDSIFNNDDYFYPIRHRMTIAEYLRIHEIQHDLDQFEHIPIRSQEESEYIYKLYINDKLKGKHGDTMELLRIYYRNRKSVLIKTLETSNTKQDPAVPGLSSFLNRIEFVPETKGVLTRAELEYLTGGWFEEYVYYLVKEYIKPQDIAIGVTISRSGVKHNNELDVVFTKGNKLFVIECKTGVQTERLFNEIVYKVCAIREALLGVSSFSYIFSLKKDYTDVLKRIAQNMDIIFVDRNILTVPRNFHLTMAQIDILSKNNI